ADLRRGVGAARPDPVGGAAARRGARGVLAVPGAVAQERKRAGDRAAAQRAAVMRGLGLESSCDETAAAVVEDGRTVRSDVVASQNEVHARYGGVVPELASRAHILNVVPVVQAALERAGMALDDVDGIAVTHAPGLIGALLVGLQTAKAMAWVT